MEEQLESTRNQIQEMDDVKNRVERLLEQLAAEGLEAQKGAPQETGSEGHAVQFDTKTVEEARQLWELLKDDDE